MPHLERWIVGVLFTIIGFHALYIASTASDGIAYYGGIGLFLAAMVFNFMMIKKTFDEKSRH